MTPRESCSRESARGGPKIELAQEGAAEIARELAERAIPNQQSWRGCAVIQIVGPEGNELFAPLRDNGGDAGRAA